MTSVGSSTIASSARAAAGRAGNTRVQSRNTVRIPPAKSITTLDLAGVTPSISKSVMLPCVPCVMQSILRACLFSEATWIWVMHHLTVTKEKKIGAFELQLKVSCTSPSECSNQTSYDNSHSVVTTHRSWSSFQTACLQIKPAASAHEVHVAKITFPPSHSADLNLRPVEKF